MVPEIGVGPVAVSVKSATTAVPPLSLTTVFSSVRDGASSSFTMIHVMSVDTGRLTVSAHSGLESKANPVNV